MPRLGHFLLSSTVISGENENGQAQFDELEIYDDSVEYTELDSDKLVTAGTVASMAETLETLTVPDNKLTCYNPNDGCTLWQISTDTALLAYAGTFAPLTKSTCKTYGEFAIYAKDCCSGVFVGDANRTCGCKTNADCPEGPFTCHNNTCAMSAAPLPNF